jgi:hypothetical protein
VRESEAFYPMKNITSRQICKVPNCERPVFSYGFCAPHYNRWVKTRDVQANIPIRPRTKNGGRCRVAGCQEQPHARGLCRIHYVRLVPAAEPPRAWWRVVSGESGLAIYASPITAAGCEMAAMFRPIYPSKAKCKGRRP